MSMLENFFDIRKDSKELFEGLEIMENPALCKKWMNQWPVIFLSLKDVDGLSYEEAENAFVQLIGREAARFSFLRESTKLSDVEKKQYDAFNVIKNGEYWMDKGFLVSSLKVLSQLLCRFYGQKTLILIDEYDVPLDKAFQHGYYPQMVSLIRGIFGQALKTNEFLQFAVLTGCLRISKESIFTGLNNFKVYSITDVDFDEYFGFTDEEVREILHYYNQDTHYEIVKQWYDGYRFGDLDVYCPWDVINYCSSHLNNPTLPPENYWINTSGNDVLNHFINNVGNEKSVTRLELEQLVNGGTVQKEIKQNLTYKELYSSMENLWSALFMTGYLTQRGKADGNRYNLAIPNREIRNIITEHILILFKENVEKDGNMLNDFCNALLYGEAEKWKRYLQNICERQSV